MVPLRHFAFLQTCPCAWCFSKTSLVRETFDILTGLGQTFLDTEVARVLNLPSRNALLWEGPRSAASCLVPRPPRRRDASWLVARHEVKWDASGHAADRLLLEDPARYQVGSWSSLSNLSHFFWCLAPDKAVETVVTLLDVLRLLTQSVLDSI
ncbi:hypothetical protein LIA77_03495 [Sarocladium implicatum]|nr:hypothetical protein LIA77_03495 [Sarocladium implicatum]